MAGLKCYLDMFSQPCRAVVILLEANQIPHESHLIKIAKGEHLSEEFKKINPARKVPVIDDGGFRLFESGAILRYLVGRFDLADHWYPSNVKKRAKIDEYLDWHHTHLRVGAAHTIFQKVFGPSMLGKEPNPEKLKETTAVLVKSEEMLDNYFLKDTKFINSDEISIADLQAVCELTQFWVTGKEGFGENQRLLKWMDDCKEKLQPHFDSAHQMIYLVRDRGIFKGKL